MAAKKGLGKGLGALLANNSAEKVLENEDNKNNFIEVDINKIEPNREQPRRKFDDKSLNELSESIKEFGILQPIIVREEDGYYTIVAGERRYRAARIAKLQKLPVVIKDYTEVEMLEIALIENLQRQDLNPIEEATCYKKLSTEFSLRQEDIAQKVGKSRNSISYSMNLLKLDKRVQNFIIDEKLTTGHGRNLLVIPELDVQFEIAEKIIEERLSVRETEKLIKMYSNSENRADGGERENDKKIPDKSKYIHLETDLTNILKTKVNIIDRKNRGKIEIEYYSDVELDRLLCMLKKLD